MAITPLPTPPSRDDPANFATEADAFLGALPTFATEANSLATDVNADAAAAAQSVIDAEAQVDLAEAQVALAVAQVALAEAAADSAQSTAGVTQWVSGTTYAIGDAVFSPINYQTFRRKTNGGGTTDPTADSTNWQQLTAGLIANDLAGGVEGSIPYQADTNDTAMLAPGTAGQVLASQGSGQPPEWIDMSAGPSGITTTMPMTSNITLTASSNQTQVVAPTADGLSIILPDATTLSSPSSPIYIIKNKSSVLTQGANTYPYHVGVRRSDGSLVAIVNAGGEAHISLIDNSTARGDWSAVGRDLSFTRVLATGSASDEGNLPPLKLSNGNHVVAFATSLWYVTKNGLATSYSVSGSYIFGVVEVDSSTLLISSTNGSTVYTYYATISDTSLSVGSAQTKALSSSLRRSYNIGLVKLSAGNYIIGFGITGSFRAIGFTLAAGTVTYGTEVNVASGADSFCTFQSLVRLTDTTAFFAYSYGSTSPWTLAAVVLTLSGTAVSVGTPLTLDTSTNTIDWQFCFIQNGSVLVVYLGASASHTVGVACTVSGTTITKGSSVNLITGNNLTDPLRKWDFSASTSLYNVWNPNRKRLYFCVTVSGTTITLRYSHNTRNVLTEVGLVRDTVNNKIFGLTGAVPGYGANTTLMAGRTNQLNIANMLETTYTTSMDLPESGDSSGPGTFNGISSSAMLPCFVTLAGIVYSIRDYDKLFILMNTVSWDGTWSGNYGVTYNKIALNWFAGSNNIAWYLNNNIENGLAVMRGSGNALAFVETVV